ncbi:MAG TPA: lysozyme inhibitor LprI family protein [Candidatus Binatia bacterium]
MKMSSHGLLRLFVVAAVITLPALPLSAQHPIDPKTLDCENWTEREVITQTEMNICAGRDTRAQRQTLERLIREFQEKLATTEPTQWARLEANQKSWQEFINKDCEWEAAFAEGGSIDPLVYEQCVDHATAERIARLRIVLCEGQGLTGECPESRKYIPRAARHSTPGATRHRHGQKEQATRRQTPANSRSQGE